MLLFCKISHIQKENVGEEKRVWVPLGRIMLKWFIFFFSLLLSGRALNPSDPPWQFPSGSRDVCHILLGVGGLLVRESEGPPCKDGSALHGLQSLGVVETRLVLFLQPWSLLKGFQETFSLDNLACACLCCSLEVWTAVVILSAKSIAKIMI